MAKQWPPCEACGEAVTTEGGFLVIRKEEMDKYEADLAHWEQEHPKDPDGSRLLSSSDLLDHPSHVHWHWGHVGCMPEGMYGIEAVSIDSVAKALDWTLHLMQKAWFPYTDWRDSVRRLHVVPSA